MCRTTIFAAFLSLLSDVMEQQGARQRAPTERYTDGELLSRYRFKGNGIAYLCDILQDNLKRETRSILWWLK